MKAWSLRYLANPAELSPAHREFWFRRFSTSLSIGNGAGAVALASFASSNFSSGIPIEAVAWPFLFFSIGIILSGAMPIALGIRHSVPKPRPKSTKNISEDESAEDAEFEHPVLMATLHGLVSNIYRVCGLASALSFIVAISLISFNFFQLREAEATNTRPVEQSFQTPRAEPTSSTTTID